ncbi:MAG: FAD-dependent monooxygenase [Lysobacterales bacterium]
MSRFDVLVSGSGVVGAVAALGLARAGLEVALIERAPAPAAATLPDNRRVVALSPASVRILSALGQWPLPPTAAAAYRQMQVQAGAHQVFFDQAAVGAAALGWIVDLHALQRQLWQALPATVQVYAPARIDRTWIAADTLHAALDDRQELSARLLIAAEGGRSDLRERAGIGVSGRDYQASALTAQVSSASPNPGIAFQRFARGGPLALLPLADGRSSLVWTRPQAEAARLAELCDAEFIAELESAGGDRFGRVDAVAARQAFPLRLQLAERVSAERLLLIGDSAHVVHPLAGLGLNLGMLDAAALIDVVSQARARSRDIGAASTLARYAAWRHGDNLLAARLIDRIEQTFGGAPTALGELAARGLDLADALAPLKHFFARQAAGWGGRVPQLARQ